MTPIFQNGIEGTAEERAKAIQEINLVAAEMTAALDNREWQARKEENKDGPFDHSKSNWASELGHPCKRHLVHCRLDWKQKKPATTDNLYRFTEGNRVETWLKRDLMDAGHELTQSQDRIYLPEYQISGRIDGQARLGRAVTWGRPVNSAPAEAKSINPMFWDSIETIDDMRQHRAWWIRGYPSQLNIYLHAKDEPFGFFILKTFGKRPKILGMLYDPDLAINDLAKIADVNKHVAAGTYPPPSPYDASICGMCDFAHLCQPIQTTKMTSVDPGDVPLLEDYLDLKKWAERFEHAKKKLIGTKDKPGKYYGLNGIAGDIAIVTTSQQRTFYEIPDDIKAPFGEKREILTTKIVRIGE